MTEHVDSKKVPHGSDAISAKPSAPPTVPAKPHGLTQLFRSQQSALTTHSNSTRHAPAKDKDISQKQGDAPIVTVKNATKAPTPSAPRRRNGSHRLTDQQVHERLKTIVSKGDPYHKYRLVEKIGQG